MYGKIIFENGCEFDGKLFGYKKNISAEIVFNTAMVGYPESLTDPSYKNQILVLTYPCIGNYGIPSEERDLETNLLKYFESDKIQVSGLIISDYCENHSHWNSNKTLNKWMLDNKIPGLYDVDTRAITKIIRDYGTMNATLMFNNDESIEKLSSNNLVKSVTITEPRIYNMGMKYNILIIDCGIKNNIIRKLLRYNITLTVVPYNYNFNVNDFDGIFISNGPGDPKECRQTIENLKNILEKNINIPIFGICLGNQLLGLASGANTIKLKYGNRGINQPVIDLKTKRCYITSQNHGYAIDSNTLSNEWYPYFINANDFSNEGIIHYKQQYFGVQFHPEACGGPDDTDFLFDQFISKIKGENINITDMNYGFYHQIRNREINKVIILGSGGLSIGQAGEFDYSGSQAIKALKEENIEVILINPNIATVQTSKNLADKIYYLSINADNVERIIKSEKPDAILINFGGQTALNCSIELYKKNVFSDYNIKVLGTEISSIIISEDREKFANLMENIGEPVAKRYIIRDIEDIDKAIKYIGFPMILRNGFALGGLGSCFIDKQEVLLQKVTELLKNMDYI